MVVPILLTSSSVLSAWDGYIIFSIEVNKLNKSITAVKESWTNGQVRLSKTIRDRSNRRQER